MLGAVTKKSYFEIVLMTKRDFITYISFSLNDSPKCLFPLLCSVFFFFYPFEKFCNGLVSFENINCMAELD